MGAQHLAEALSSNERLESLNLRKNGLSAAACRAFAAILEDTSGATPGTRSLCCNSNLSYPAQSGSI